MPARRAEAPTQRQSPTLRPPGSRLFILIDQDADSRTVEILILSGRERPEEGRKSGEAEQQGDRNKKAEPAHRAQRRSRSALPSTSSEEADMAAAAIIGVTSPQMARGTASRL